MSPQTPATPEVQAPAIINSEITKAPSSGKAGGSDDTAVAPAPDEAPLTPFLIARPRVIAVNRLSPTFVRITFGGEELVDFATPGAVFDLRIKLIFPTATGALPSIRGEDGWYQGWLALPESERGSMRTYSIRHIRAHGSVTEVDVDFVLHLAAGSTGPASTWASEARVGDEILMVGPRRGQDWGGIEFNAEGAGSVVLVGDETAAPAIARIIEDSGADLRGTAFIEVPTLSDVLPVHTPEGFEVRWLARTPGSSHGSLLVPTVLEYLGSRSDVVVASDVDAGASADADELVWQTPASAAHEEPTLVDADVDESAHRYFWIAGESGVVTTLRRHLVSDHGVDRRHVAFMGYWRHGVAMRG